MNNWSFELTDEILSQVANALDKSRLVGIAIEDDEVNVPFGERMNEYLSAEGFQLVGVKRVSPMPVVMTNPIVISSDGLGQGITIMPGIQVVGIDVTGLLQK
jgi:hypothetical protein